MNIVNLLLAFVYLISWLLPNHYLPWLAAYQDSLTIFSLLALCLYWLVKTNQAIKISNFNLILLTTSLIPLVQWIFGISHYLGDTVLSFYYLILLALAFTLSSNIKKDNLYLFFCITIIIAACLSTWIALRQLLLLSGSIWVVDLAPNARPFANLGQPNNFSTLIGLGLAAALYLYEKKIINNISSASLALFLIIGLVISQSRTPWLALIAVYLFLLYKHYSISKLRLTPIKLTLLIILFAIVTVIFPLFTKLLYLQSTELSQRALAASRLDLYQQFLYAITEGPLYGYGVLQSHAAQIAASNKYQIYEIAEYTHNIMLDILVWFGPIIGLIIIGSTGYWIIKIGLSAKSIESITALLAAGFILTHSMLEYPHAYAQFLIPLGIYLGKASQDLSNKYLFSVPKKTFIALTLFTAFLGGIIIYEYILIEKDFRAMRFETSNIISKHKNHTPNIYLLDNLKDHISFARVNIEYNLSDQEINEIKKTVLRYPYSFALIKYINILAINNKEKELETFLNILKKMHKDHHYAQAQFILKQLSKQHPYLLEFLDKP